MVPHGLCYYGLGYSDVEHVNILLSRPAQIPVGFWENGSYDQDGFSVLGSTKQGFL